MNKKIRRKAICNLEAELHGGNGCHRFSQKLIIFGLNILKENGVELASTVCN